jgi:signal transduction histidine kinase
VNLACEVPDEIHLTGDIPMIQRMLSNLLDNAIKYTPSGGMVGIEVAGDQTQVHITIKDTGIGISSSDLSRVFERFYRCDQSRSLAGTGLGLSLARAIARVHGGDITVVSMPNQGSTFAVTLPKILVPQD